MVELKLGATVGEKGQVVIPKALRELFGILPKTEVVFSVQMDKLVLEKSNPEQTLSEFVNAVKEKVRFPKEVDWDAMYGSQFP